MAGDRGVGRGGSPPTCSEGGARAAGSDARGEARRGMGALTGTLGHEAYEHANRDAGEHHEHEVGFILG